MSTSRVSIGQTKRFTTIGTVAKAIGADGSVLVREYGTVSPDHLVGETVFIVPPPLRGRSRTVTHAEYRDTGLVIRLSGADSRADSQDLVGTQLVVAAGSEAVDDVTVDTDDQLVGWAVRSADGSLLGEVTDYFETQAHAVIEVVGDSSRGMIPLVDEFIVDVDASTHTLTVSLIPGMLQDTP